MTHNDWYIIFALSPQLYWNKKKKCFFFFNGTLKYKRDAFSFPDTRVLRTESNAVYEQKCFQGRNAIFLWNLITAKLDQRTNVIVITLQLLFCYWPFVLLQPFTFAEQRPCAQIPYSRQNGTRAEDASRRIHASGQLPWWRMFARVRRETDCLHDKCFGWQPRFPGAR